MATATRVTAIDGDGHIMENRGRLVELLEEPYREFRSVIMESSALVPLDGIDRNLGTRLNKGSARTTAEWIEALERGPMAKTVVFPTLGLFSGFIKNPDYQAAFCRAYNTWVASDYPHWDCEYPESLHRVMTREDLSESQREALLHGTAARFYGLDG